VSDAEEFHVIAYDLNTNARLCEIPANNLRFDSRLNDAGAISFDISLQSPGVAGQVASILGYEGNPYAVYVDRNGVIVWGGICWTGLYTRSSGLLSVGGKEFLSYFDQRIAAADYSQLTYPAGIDPAQLLALALTDAQNIALQGAGASIGLSVVYTASGIPVIVPGYPIAQQTAIQSIINDVTALVVPGFGGTDIQVLCAYDAFGVPQRTAYTRSPRSGNPAGSTGLIFDLSSCIDYTWPTDATQAGNTLIVTGSGNGAAAPTTTVNAPGVPLGGLGQSPRLDKLITTTAQSQQQVQQMANGLAQQYGKPVTTPTVTILTNGAQPLGSWSMGDDARLYMPPGDDRFPNGKSEYWRVVQQQISVPDAGAATAVLTFNVPPSF